MKDCQSVLPVLLTEKQASVRYGFSVHWFRRKRWEGGGPVYRKIGGAVRYSLDDLERFFFSGRSVRNTAED